MKLFNILKKKSNLTALTVIGIIALIGLLFFGVGALIATLWNWLMPDIFGLSTITIPQALGLLVLTNILFGGIKASSNNQQEQKPGWNVSSNFINIKKNEVAEEDEEITDEIEIAEKDEDEIYEDWWASEGEAYFENYLQEKSNQ